MNTSTNPEGSTNPGGVSPWPETLTPVDFSALLADLANFNFSLPWPEGAVWKTPPPTDSNPPSIAFATAKEWKTPIPFAISRTKTDLGNTSWEDMQTLLRRESIIGDANKMTTQYIDSYALFERVRTSVLKILEKEKKNRALPEAFQMTEKALSENLKYITRLKVHLWIFDRLVNGSEEFIKKDNTQIISENGDTILFPVSNLKDIPWYVNYTTGALVDSMKFTTWSPIIALYGKSKSILLLNQAYYQAMGTNQEEFTILLQEGRIQELFKRTNTKQYQRLTTLLSQWLGYKNEPLETERTNKTITWNSFWNEKSGSIRIGEDITHWVHPLVPITEFEGVSLNTERDMSMFCESIEGILPYISDETIVKIIRTWLRALLACASAVDMFWDHGPYYMNIIADGEVIGNKNYADLVGKTANHIPLTEFYDAETLRAIEKSFIEGEKVWHYEQIFPITSKDDIIRPIAWHRYFPKDIIWLPKGITVWFWTTAITALHKSRTR